ncbi:hypothetical protein Peur_005692 [Populus x canadensis]
MEFNSLLRLQPLEFLRFPALFIVFSFGDFFMARATFFKNSSNIHFHRYHTATTNINSVLKKPIQSFCSRSVFQTKRANGHSRNTCSLPKEMPLSSPGRSSSMAAAKQDSVNFAASHPLDSHAKACDRHRDVKDVEYNGRWTLTNSNSFEIKTSCKKIFF